MSECKWHRARTCVLELKSTKMCFTIYDIKPQKHDYKLSDAESEYRDICRNFNRNKIKILRDLVCKLVRVKNSEIIHNAQSHSNVGYYLQSWCELKELSHSSVMWNKRRRVKQKIFYKILHECFKIVFIKKSDYYERDGKVASLTA